MATKERHLILLNPVAGKGRAGERKQEIEDLLHRSGLNFDLVLTERPGHAMDLAEASGPLGYTVAVAAGGDGTVNETINGLMRAKASGKPVPALGVLSVGRGNDFAYGASVPGDLAANVAILAAGRRKPLDAGFIQGGDYPRGRYFGNGVGIGFDTIVGLEAAKFTRVHGFAAYVLGALKTLAIYPKAPHVRLRHDNGTIEQRSHQISIMNGKRMGGTFFMAPYASNRDGLLDLCMASELKRMAMLKLIGMYVQGTQDRHPSIRVERSASFRIEAPEGGLVCHADGETICRNGSLLELSCVTSALSILCDGETP